MRVIGLSFRVCLYFAAHPGASLTTRQIVSLFAADPDRVALQLRDAVDYGFLSCDVGRSHRPSTYTAGPQIARLCSLEPMEAM